MRLRNQLLALCVISCISSPAMATAPFGLLSRSLMGQSDCDDGSDCCDGDDCCDSECDSICRSTNCCPERYCSIFGGWNRLEDYSGERPSPPAQLDGSFNDGWLIGAATGCQFHPCFRGELELAFRSNTADAWTVAGTPGPWSGHLFTYSGMANVYHDIRYCQPLGFTPYLGIGIGYSAIDGNFSAGAINVGVDDHSFAWQAIAGCSRPIANCVDLFTEYRLFDADFELENVSLNPNVSLGDHDGRHHNVIVGLRFTH